MISTKNQSDGRSSARGQFSYPSTARLLKKRDFELVQSRAKRISTRYFLILVAKAQDPQSRLGLIVTKKVDKRAVKRNLLRRRIREVFRLNRHKLTKQCDLVIIARKDSVLRSFAEIKQELLGALIKSGYLQADD